MPSIFRCSIFSISTFLFHAGHIIAPQAPGAPPLPPPGALPPGHPATLTLQLSHPPEPAPKQQEEEKLDQETWLCRIHMVVKRNQIQSQLGHFESYLGLIQSYLGPIRSYLGQMQ